jgi:hypothetical protein
MSSTTFPRLAVAGVAAACALAAATTAYGNGGGRHHARGTQAHAWTFHYTTDTLGGNGRPTASHIRKWPAVIPAGASGP